MKTNNAFVPAEKINFSTVEQERLRFLDYCNSMTNKTVIVNLERVKQCDSAGLAFLIEVKRIAKTRGYKSKIINFSGQTCALAEFYGIRELLQTNLTPSANGRKSWIG